ncbi:glycerate kinase [Actibacterium sp. 188UL27-1]|uniref:glycerate kinase type-2 family protein n=1 Tax=Actibacterium sp. 188UL27-1 TaxID=2786961 RepID=UPI00195D1DD1|nr:glycerate kinase [Actibacterium sp. 188UL27-1]MBM7066181.1 glycerate kinase [Actibacterium sp. 188UL27-1]
MTPPDLLRRMFDEAVKAADPMACISAALPPKPTGRVVVIGAGKASARMAEAVEQVWGPCDGLVITRYGYARPCQGIRIVEAAHPVPDQAGVDATRELLDILDGLGPDDFVLALISGGGSALLCAPAGDMTLSEKQQINQALLVSGAPINQMNIVRKHLSAVKGGQLAVAAHPARMLTLTISDVAGDDPAFIASGPTVADPSTPQDALAIVDRWAIDLPPSAKAVLAGQTGVVQPGDVRLATCDTRIIAAPSQSLDAAAELAKADGYDVRILADDLEGEARDLGAEQARMALGLQARMTSGDAPILLLSGGECTVTRRGDGVGGPNAEAMLSAAISLQAAPGIWAMACDTDGVDGAAEVAGALIGPDILKRAKDTGIDPQSALDRNDGHTFFEKTTAQIVTGPTLTNVNDFRAFLIQPPVR